MCDGRVLFCQRCLSQYLFFPVPSSHSRMTPTVRIERYRALSLLSQNQLEQWSFVRNIIRSWSRFPTISSRVQNTCRIRLTPFSSVNFLRTKKNAILIHIVATYSESCECQDTREQAVLRHLQHHSSIHHCYWYSNRVVRPMSVKIKSPTVTASGYPGLLARFLGFSSEWHDIAMIQWLCRGDHDECPKCLILWHDHYLEQIKATAFKLVTKNASMTQYHWQLPTELYANFRQCSNISNNYPV